MNFKKHITEKNVLIGLISLLLISTFLDIYTALTSPLFDIAETNPIFIITGSKIPLLILTVITTLWIIKSITKSISIFKIFLFTVICVFLTYGHFIGMITNILATERYESALEEETAREELIKEYREYNVKEKLISYHLLVGLIMVIPFFISTIAFWTSMYFYNQRKPKREKIMDEIYRLSQELKIK